MKIGSATYQGRPLTKETRAFMNMPESRTSSIRREKLIVKDSKKNNLNGFDGDADGDTEGEKLGIDDFLGEEGENVKEAATVESSTLDNNHQNSKDHNDDDDLVDSGVVVMKENVQTNEKNKKNISTKQKRKKKSKYKNLR